MKRISEAMEVSRSNLYARLESKEPAERSSVNDDEVLTRIKKVIESRPSYGYRRVTAILNQGKKPEKRVNHKRIYRIMRDAGLLLPKHTGRVERAHEGKVITLKSNLRWCSDMFEIRCWNGDKVHVAFSLDCCDREAISYVAKSHHLDGGDVRDLMAQAVEARLGPGTTKVPRPVEWLSDNGPQYTSDETRAFGEKCGLIICNTPAYSPQSNGAAEAFVKTFKRDYVYLNDLWDAEHVLKQLPGWFEDYNENAPHKGLKMKSPKEFRRENPG
jgi:transposase InsO family protein